MRDGRGGVSVKRGEVDLGRGVVLKSVRESLWKVEEEVACALENHVNLTQFLLRDQEPHLQYVLVVQREGFQSSLLRCLLWTRRAVCR